MTIILPEGFEIPQDAKPGEPFESVATIQQNEDGSFNIVAIDGVELGEGREEPEEDMRGQMRGDLVKLPYGDE